MTISNFRSTAKRKNQHGRWRKACTMRGQGGSWWRWQGWHQVKRTVHAVLLWLAGRLIVLPSFLRVFFFFSPRNFWIFRSICFVSFQFRISQCTFLIAFKCVTGINNTPFLVFVSDFSNKTFKITFQITFEITY